MNRLTAKLVDRLTAKLVVLVKLLLTKLENANNKQNRQLMIILPKIKCWWTLHCRMIKHYALAYYHQTQVTKLASSMQYFGCGNYFLLTLVTKTVEL